MIFVLRKALVLSYRLELGNTDTESFSITKMKLPLLKILLSYIC